MTTTTRTVAASKGHILGNDGRVLAIVAGLAAIGLAIYQVANPGPPGGATYETFGDYAREAGFLVFLLSSGATAALARARGFAPSRAGVLVPIGYSLIAAGVAIGLAVREELDWFFALAGPGLLMSAVGFVVWAVWSTKRAVFPTWAAVLLGVGGLTAIILSEAGTGVLIGSFWLYLSTVRGERT